MSAAAAAARRSVRVGGGGATNLVAVAARRDRLRALPLTPQNTPIFAFFVAFRSDIISYLHMHYEDMKGDEKCKNWGVSGG